MSQKQELNKILNQQFKNNTYYSGIRVALIAALYASLLDGNSLKKRIHRITGDTNDAVILAMIALIWVMYKNNKAKGSNEIAESIERSHILEESHSVGYKIQRKQIGDEKEAYIMSDIQANGLKKKWFYLCSSHADSAKDHKPYQGKLYIDDNCDDPKCLALAREYHMQSYQWVIGKPVWMVTRPNCRHYFKALAYEEVAGKSYDNLVKEYKMHRTIGDRPIMQTLRGGDNIEVVIKSYEERLRLHLAMNKVRSNDFLRNAIDKDRLLLKKWYLKKKNSNI